MEKLDLGYLEKLVDDALELETEESLNVFLTECGFYEWQLKQIAEVLEFKNVDSLYVFLKKCGTKENVVQCLKEVAKIKNKGLTPDIDTDYYCLTCGSRTGEEHPETGYCFICNTDNWEPIDSSIAR